MDAITDQEEAIDQSMQDLVARFNDLTEEAKGVNQEIIHELNTGIGALETRVDTLVADLDRIFAGLDALEQEIETESARLTSEGVRTKNGE